MKRILFAAIIAVGIHGLLLCMEFDWISGKYSGRSKSRIMTMTLIARQPVKAELKPVVSKSTSKKRAAKPKRQKKAEKSPLNTKAGKIEPELMEKPDDFAAEQALDVSGTQELKLTREAIPIYDKNPSPEYPLIARRRGFQGTVVLEVLVDRNGRVGDLRIFKSSGYKVLDSAAEESVREWIFKPAIKGNENIEMWVRVPVCFQLK
ncbi:MAG: TonB family protein [Proteobacteria bacterium]|nr:TonB family protein [Pseudomonadota bacterium]